MKYEVIDNFLDKEYFDSLQTFFIDEMPWFFAAGISEEGVPEGKLFYMYHMIYQACTPRSVVFDKMHPLLKKLEADHLLRIKVNFYPNTSILKEHDYHIDYQEPHTGALLALNTCDGYTKIRKTGEKYPSVANTLLVFDSSKDHCSTTTTNALGRFNININYS